MSGVIAAIYSKIAALMAWFGSLFVAVFVALWDIFRDVFAWVFDQLMSVAVAASGSINVNGITANLGGYGSIPANMMEVMGAIGLGQALALITAAITIRIGLQLIPFVRLGS